MMEMFHGYVRVFKVKDVILNAEDLDSCEGPCLRPFRICVCIYIYIYIYICVHIRELQSGANTTTAMTP